MSTTSKQDPHRILSDDEVKGILNLFLKEEQKAKQDINLPFDDPSKVVFNMLVDAMKMFTKLTKSTGPTRLFLPKSLEIILDMYLKRHVENSVHKGLRNSPKLLGCNIVFDSPDFKFE